MPTPRDPSSDTLPPITKGVSEDTVWPRVARRLRAEVGEDVYASWLASLHLDRLEPDTAHLSVPTRFLKSWIQSHYSDRIMTTLAAEGASVGRLAITVRSSTRTVPPSPGVPAPTVLRQNGTSGMVEAARRPTETPAPGPEAPDALTGSPLDRRLTFGSFLVGASNQIAYGAAQRVVEAASGDTTVFNPVYVHASVGLGKTHLLQAIAQGTHEAGRRMIYLTAERFMYGFVAALKAQTSIAFKDKLRAIDVLIIDDVQFLQGRTMQHEFCHTLNALIDSGRQIVIAAERPPSELENLDERVRSRLAGGLCVEILPLDEDLRTRIVAARIEAAQVTHPNFVVSAPIVAYVAHTIQTNGRDLDGAVNRLLAHATLSGAPLTIEVAEVAIRDLVRTREPKRVKIEDIQKLVATRYNVNRSDILSSRRTATVVRPRQIAMYLSKSLTLRSLPEIGRRFGGRDHTTVLHAVRKIEGLCATDPALGEEIELLKRMLQD